jgi:hypothetical protein
MEEQRGNFTRRFEEGVGWIVAELPGGASVPANAAVVRMPPPEPAAPVRIVTVGDVPLSLAQQVLTAAGFVAVPRELVEALPKTHQETLLKAASQAPAALDEAAMIARIEAAVTMEELETLMDGITTPAVIAVAEKKAMELTEGQE